MFTFVFETNSIPLSVNYDDGDDDHLMVMTVLIAAVTLIPTVIERERYLASCI